MKKTPYLYVDLLDGALLTGKPGTHPHIKRLPTKQAQELSRKLKSTNP